jgi:hypothetical protein
MTLPSGFSATSRDADGAKNHADRYQRSSALGKVARRDPDTGRANRGRHALRPPAPGDRPLAAPLVGESVR